MKHVNPRLLFFWIVLLSSKFLVASESRVFFIGNSYTYTNNLPQIIADLALTQNDTLVFDSYTPGGYTLDQHYTDSIGINKIIAGGWDYVVLQEQSQLPAFDGYYSNGANGLCRLIEEYNPCARKLFYMTWGRKNGDASNCSFFPPVCTYEGMDSMLHLNYIQMAMANSAFVSPVGRVWRNIRENNPSIELYDIDGSHPSVAGSYAAACSFYSVIFGKDPSSCTYDFVLTPADAITIRNAARLIAYDSLASWNFSDNNTTSNFDYLIGSGTNEIQCIDNSINAEGYYWDFGDGDTSTLKNPSHSYLSDGTYTITLTTNNCDLGSVMISALQKTVTFCSHTPTIFPDSVIICPNETDTIWTQPGDAYQWLSDYGDTIPGATNQYIISTGSALYSVLTTSNGCTEMSAPVNVYSFHNMIVYWVDSVSTSTHPDTLCMGDTALLMLHPNKPDGPYNHYQWYLNGSVISGATDDTLIVSSDGIYEVKVQNSICPVNFVYESTPISLNFLNCNIGIDELFAAGIRIFPNPAKESLQVTISNQMTGKSYSLFDLNGRKLISGILENTTNTIEVESLKSGVYFFKIDGIFSTEKIMVIHDQR